MNVKLATHVLIESVGKHLYTYHGPEFHGTADLCMMMDTFFDLLSIKNDIEHTTSIKEFIHHLQVQMTKDSNGLLTISCSTLKDGKRV